MRARVTCGCTAAAPQLTAPRARCVPAVCLFDAGVIAELAAQGHPLVPGLAGENFTLAGLPWADCARPGARIALGATVLLEISEARAAGCAALAPGGDMRGDMQ
jgi:MOSC domain-containing protein YiiM